MGTKDIVAATQVTLPVQTFSVLAEANDRAQIDGQGRLLRGSGTLVPTPQPSKVVALGQTHTLTTIAAADGFASASTANIITVDLHGMTQARLVGRVSVVSNAGAKLQLRFAGAAFTTVVASYLILGTTSVEIALQTLGVIDSGWIDIVTAAKIDANFLGIMTISGDGAASPVVNHLRAEFR